MVVNQMSRQRFKLGKVFKAEPVYIYLLCSQNVSLFTPADRKSANGMRLLVGILVNNNQLLSWIPMLRKI